MPRIRIVSRATGERSEADGLWLKSYDPDGKLGMGEMVFTENRSDAKEYPTSREAIEEWKRISTTHPIRLDGKPNRPLTQFTIEVR